MMRTYVYCIWLFLAATLLSCTSAGKGRGIFDRLSYYHPEGFRDSLLVGRYAVYENRDTREGRKIQLYVAVTPALVPDSVREPIFIIEGGPGVGASLNSHFYTEEDATYRRYHDIVYIDARGTGKSDPLICPELQAKDAPGEYFKELYPFEALEACLRRYQDTVNFNCYKSKYIVEDLEEVRRWLGYGKINLYGVSFGGKVSLMYMGRYPTSIHRVVLHAPDAPDIDYVSKRGQYSQRALDLLFEFCEGDSLCHTTYPNFRKEFEGVMHRLKSTKIERDIKLKDSLYRIGLIWWPIAARISAMLYQDDEFIRIPYIMHEAYLENYTPLLEAMVVDWKTGSLFADGMWLSNICGEDIPMASRNHEETDKESFLGDYIFQSRKAACGHWPVSPAEPETYSSVVSDIPTLLISGNLDPALPPETGVKILENLSNGQHITIPYMGHIFTDLSNPECYDDYVLAFFDDKVNRLNSACFREMKPKPFKLAPSEE